MQKEIKVTPFYYDNVLAKDYPVIIQLGGRFSSKSYNTQIELAMNLGSKKDYTLLVIEDLEKGMISGFYAGLKDKIELFEHEAAYNMTKSPPTIVNSLNGNKALFSGYSSDQQKKSIKSMDQITEIVVEEGEWLTYDDFIALLHQLRGGEAKDRKLSILLNPVNEYCFINEMFVQPLPDKVIEYFPNSRRPKVFEKSITTEFEYEGKTIVDTTKVLICISTHHDNPYLTTTQRASIEVLRTTDPEKYKQLGESRFIKSGGAYFKEFDKDIHVIEPFVIPSTWTRYRSLDYGLDMTAMLWFAIDPHNNVYVYKELHESDLIISKACERIKSINGTDQIRLTYYPQDLNARQKSDGKTVYETFVENGVTMTPTSNKRIAGWLAVKEAIKVFQERNVITGQEEFNTKLKVFSNCTNLIANIQQVKKSETDPNDVSDTPHELTHIVDALRYFCITRFSKFEEEEKKAPHDEYDDYIGEMGVW